MAQKGQAKGLFQDIVRPVLGYTVSFFLVMFLIFTMVYKAAGEPVLPTAQTPHSRRAPVQHPDIQWTQLPAAYVQWLGNALRGDFGKSLINRRPVTELVHTRLLNSLMLNLYTLTIMLITGMALGLFLAFRKSAKDRSHPIEWLLYVLYAVPDFILGILLLMSLSFGLGWFPSHGIPAFESGDSFLFQFVQLLHYMTLPALTLAASGVVFMARFTRSSITEQLETPYVFALKSRGIHPRTIMLRILRNTLTPFLTLSGFLIPALVGGAVVVESIFSFPGIGKTFYDAVIYRDYPVILAMSLISTAFVYIGLSISNGLVRLTDPRIRHDVSG